MNFLPEGELDRNPTRAQITAVYTSQWVCLPTLELHHGKGTHLYSTKNKGTI